MILARFLGLHEVLVHFYTAINKFLSVVLILLHVTHMLHCPSKVNKVNIMIFVDIKIDKYKATNCGLCFHIY